MNSKSYLPQFTLLVNTSDGYDDCWPPFFRLLRKYWPHCDAPTLLNTGRKEWHTADWPGLACTRVEKDAARRMTWSECLLAGLNQINTPLVLYFQEDYFVHQPVRDELVRKAATYMLDHPEVGHIALTRHCSHGPYDPHAEPWLQSIHPKARYRISTQAALWRVDTLRRYLHPAENGWMFEIFGTWRARRRPDIFLSTRWDSDLGGPAIDYLHTGIIKGKWLREIDHVFRSNGINVDFSKRGYYVPRHSLINKVDVIQKLLERPRHLFSQYFGQ